ncbi:MAG: DUF1499 domain-containing protein [Acetobacteraceae bacterium]
MWSITAHVRSLPVPPMTPFAWLLGLFLPACGAVGAAGLPPPQVLDVAHLVRPASPNTALAAPAGFRPRPDLATHPYPLPAPALLARVIAVARAQPRTYLAASFPAAGQADFVARSAFWNFPDLITAAVRPDGPGHSRLILYSRSVYGSSDFGVNRARLRIWLAALATGLPPAPKPPVPKTASK